MKKRLIAWLLLLCLFVTSCSAPARQFTYAALAEEAEFSDVSWSNPEIIDVILTLLRAEN